MPATHNTTDDDAPVAKASAAEQFLTTLDEGAEQFCFQTFDDSPAKRRHLAQTIHGSLEDRRKALAALNRQGAGIFVTINEVPAGKSRTDGNVTRVRAVYADFDPPSTNSPPETWPIEPSILVESSPGKLHAYWLVDGLPINEFQAIQKAVIRTFGSDKSIRDLPRVMRLPGTIHKKDPDNPHRVRLIHSRGGLPYGAEEIRKAFPPQPEDNARPKPSTRDDPVVKALIERGLALGWDVKGHLNITCPWANEHTTASSVSSTSYFPPHTGGYAGSGFKCQHGHCADRGIKDLRDWLGLPSVYVMPAPPEWPHQGPEEGGSVGDEWPRPATDLKAERSNALGEYPEWALPTVMADAVRAVVVSGKMPMALAGCSALAALSLAAQHIADVERDALLVSPCSINVLAVGASGERKSTADKLLSADIRAWMSAKGHEMQSAVAKGIADLAAWKVEIAALETAMKKEAVGGKSPGERSYRLDQLRHDLADAHEQEPAQPVLPNMMHEDVTPEGLAWSVASGWPSQALWSDEGAVVLGGYAMRTESALAFFGLLNRLWDGGTFMPTRKIAETREIRGKRFTTNLMVQPALLETLLGNDNARGIGLLSRFLIASPESTMGSRMYQEPDATHAEAIGEFGGALRRLLHHEPKTNEDGELIMPRITLDPDAKAIWAEFYNEIEAQLGGDDGPFDAVKDFASKSAENAARVAALFHLLDYRGGDVGVIGVSAMTGAIAIMRWHLAEAVRIFGEANNPEDVADAKILSEWLVKEARRRAPGDKIPMADIQRRAPKAVRRRDRADAALDILESPSIWHVRRHATGRAGGGRPGTLVEVNPRLLAGTAH